MNIAELPNEEDDEFEFKSSKTPVQELKKKLQRAVSGFANSGGGFFIAGVDSQGNPDGGIPNQINRTALRDWIDQCIHLVDPQPKTDVLLVDDDQGRGTIEADRCVVAVRIPASLHGPHMAPDNKYYIRAGVHTVPARHFIVESIWARRHLSQPRLVHLADIDEYSRSHSYVSIDIIAVTDAPAMNVAIGISPNPDPKSTYVDFPISVPIIDRLHSFGFRFEVENNVSCPYNLSVTYTDVAQNKFKYTAIFNPSEIVSSFGRSREPLHEISRTLTRLAEKLR